MDLFHRTTESRVTWDQEQNAFVVHIDMTDAFHDMGVRVNFSYPDLIIREVEPRMNRTPYPVCPTALARASQCIGLKVQVGLQLLMNRSVGGSEGCRHITQLLLDACNAAVQGLLAIQSAQGVQVTRRIPPDEKISFMEERGLSLRDSCTAYATARRNTG